jgi:predicted Zn-dependent protease
MIFSHSRWARVALALALATLAMPGRAQEGTASSLIARSLAALRAGNVSGARQLANAAVSAEPMSGLAHAVAARMALAESDGITAEAELSRARDAGFDGMRTRQLLAHARLLQGDARGALATARTTAPRYWTYGLRVQARALAAMGNAGAGNELLQQAIARAPNDPALWTDVGRFRLSVDDIAGAIAASARAVSLDPGSTDALLLRAQLVRTQFGLEASLPWYRAALDRDPHHHDALVDYAATLGDAGHAREMLAAARRALAVRPQSPQALYLLAVLAMRADQPTLARAVYERVGGALDGMPGPLLLGAVIDLRSGEDEQAAAKLRNLIGLQPYNVRARQLLASALLRLGSASEALDLLRPLALRPDADSYTLALVGRAFEARREASWAGRFLDRASRGEGGSVPFDTDNGVAVLDAAANGLAPGEPSSAIPIIRAMLSDARTADALARAEAVSRSNPGAPEAALVLGDVLMALRRPGDAVRAYRRAADVSFDEPTMLRLVEALAEAGDETGAAAALALFGSQNPSNPSALRMQALRASAQGDAAGAIEILEELRSRLGNRDPALLVDLARAALGGRNATAAVSYAAAAYALAPADARIAHAYARSLQASGDLDGARQLAEKATAIAPAHAEYRWHLAQVYAALGRVSDARIQARLALSDPRFLDRAEASRLAA